MSESIDITPTDDGFARVALTFLMDAVSVLRGEDNEHDAQPVGAILNGPDILALVSVDGDAQLLEMSAGHGWQTLAAGVAASRQYGEARETAYLSISYHQPRRAHYTVRLHGAPFGELETSGRFTPA